MKQKAYNIDYAMKVGSMSSPSNANTKNKNIYANKLAIRFRPPRQHILVCGCMYCLMCQGSFQRVYDCIAIYLDVGLAITLEYLVRRKFNQCSLDNIAVTKRMCI